jgi:hypothetical protein
MDDHGRAVQVEPMKSVLKAPGAMLLKLRYDELLLLFPFNYSLRQYTVACSGRVAALCGYLARVGAIIRAPLQILAGTKYGGAVVAEAADPRPSWYPDSYERLTEGWEKSISFVASYDAVHGWAVPVEPGLTALGCSD